MAEGVTEKKLSNYLKKYEGMDKLVADFAQVKTIKDMGVRLASKGRLEMGTSGYINWEIKKPSPVQIHLSGKEVVIKSLDETGKMKKQVYDVKSAPREMTDSVKQLMKLLTFNAGYIFENFHIKMSKPGVISLRHKSDALPFNKMKLYLRDGGLIGKINMEEKSGDVIDINFTNIKILGKK